ncbi:MAG: hypothetical protein AAGC85_17575 [Bacteroidota bacterium]
MEKYTSYIQMVLQFIMVAAIIFFFQFFFKQNKNLTEAMEGIKTSIESIDSINQRLDNSMNLVDSSVLIVGGVIKQIQETDLKIEALKRERRRLVRDMRAIVNEKDNENKLMLDSLTQIEQSILALQRRAEILTQ